ncbi:sulfate adenylyltransferase [Thermococcus thioreducens]|uniref:Sulfate adenylyltransferase n=1 Tax=Thermococcus thioreducens TaxID=277988 RepID=A0A0Q2MQ62_9EURY|nr:sulfate adenylyltransferase [Thermococcus thioreducens]ASJ11588.1 sulfate adenylyltransferase [Thermococcus thioreducens]KQH81807.1 sulfate adenylyltransferase [Thermococcus thioreducens]SEW03909.1 sulfate adenylyltransferase [Thermococcus thioreducens]
MVSKPHGGRLVRRLVAERTRERILSEQKEYPRVRIEHGRAIDLENIAHGVYSPLKGFLTSDDFGSVLDHMRLSDDTPWTIPIVLDIKEKTFDEGDAILLYYDDLPIARMHVEEIYTYDKREFAVKVFKTDDPAHPGVSRVMDMGDYLVGGEIELLNELPNPFAKYTLRPVETRVLFKERGWKTIVAFQTRNVPHLGHEYVQKAALTFVDGLFINPVLGRKKKGDYRDEVIIKAYETLFEHYYPRDAATLATVRYEMRYAGPREAIHHAIMRKNFGATHFIVGRDHAGVGDYYGPYEAWDLFGEFPDLGITPMFIRESFYCRKCGGMVNAKICPHSKEFHVHISGTKLRKMIMTGEQPPEYMMRPEVFEVVRSFENPFVE